jgi:hypothetical protein
MAGPLEELVKRIHRRIEAFAEDQGIPEAEVSIELFDGSLHRLRTLSAEPGYGFISFRPLDDDEQELIVPLGTVREIRVTVPGPEQQLGFSAAHDAA